MGRTRIRLSAIVVALLLPIPLFLFRLCTAACSLLLTNKCHSLSSFDSPVITSIPDVLSGSPFFLSYAQEQQIQNFRDGKAIMLNIHITHHAGTTMCSRFGRAVGAPRKFCNHPSPEDIVPKSYPDYNPWMANETSANIRNVRQAFRFLAWEHRKPPKPSLSNTNWEDPHLVSVLIIRDPIARLLAGDGFVASAFPGVAQYAKDPILFSTSGGGNTKSPRRSSHHEWFRFSHHSRNDNRALRILAGHDCCVSQNTTDKQVTDQHLQAAKDLISRFTFVLDQACFDSNLQALARILNVTLMNRPGGNAAAVGGRSHSSNRDRIPFADIYEYLLERNAKDIELYQWAKRRSLVRCLDESSS
jgi:hypothetical protein